MRRSKESVMEALKSRDMLLASVTRSIEDLDKTINLLGERYEDWYGLYFPEFKAEDKLQFCNTSLIMDRENLDEKALAAIVGQKKATELVAASKASLGVKLSPKDHSECLSMARTIISLETLRKDYEAYQKELGIELCPNMSEVGGSDIAAKLVSHVGSLRRLAMLPASAIQVLGAEKALFKHLKNKRVPPPKHGIIFQHARISSSPKAVRGKVARVLANQLCLAAKADAFSKRNIAPLLVKKFDDRFAQIMKEYEAQKVKRLEAPKVDAQKAEAPKQAMPNPEAPKHEAKPNTQRPEAQKHETPKQHGGKMHDEQKHHAPKHEAHKPSASKP
jgi:nucleolar protein 56